MRLFVAIELDEPVRARLKAMQDALRPRCDGVRWVKPELLHLTVKFLGDVEKRDVGRVSKAIETAASQSRPFDLELEGCGCFPTRGEVRIVWVGGSEATGELTQCVERVEGLLEDRGYARERKDFNPHITIGRVKFDSSDGAIRSAAQKHEFTRAMQPVASLTLMSSVLLPKGPTYTPVSRFPLHG